MYKTIKYDSFTYLNSSKLTLSYDTRNRNETVFKTSDVAKNHFFAFGIFLFTQEYSF